MASESDIALCQARFPLPFMIESGARNTIAVQIVATNGGDISGTYTRTVSLIKPDGTEIQLSTGSVGSVTTSHVITYTDDGTLPMGMGYVIAFEFFVNGVSRYRFRNDAAIVRRNIACPIASSDLYSVVSSLNPSASKPIHGMANLDPYIGEAWTRIQRRLIENGNRPNLILSPSALHDVTVLLSLALVFEDFATRLNAAYMEQARMYREQYEQAWARLSFQYAADDGTTGASNRRKSGSSAVFLGTARLGRY